MALSDGGQISLHPCKSACTGADHAADSTRCRCRSPRPHRPPPPRRAARPSGQLSRTRCLPTCAARCSSATSCSSRSACLSRCERTTLEAIMGHVTVGCCRGIPGWRGPHHLPSNAGFARCCSNRARWTHASGASCWPAPPAPRPARRLPTRPPAGCRTTLGQSAWRWRRSLRLRALLHTWPPTRPATGPYSTALRCAV